LFNSHYFCNAPLQVFIRISLTDYGSVGAFFSCAFTMTQTFPDRCQWYPWGGWSRCQGVCGAGVQKRMRRCNGCVPGTGACQGNCQLYRLL